MKDYHRTVASLLKKAPNPIRPSHAKSLKVKRNPIKGGYSQATLHKNIAELMRAGYAREQAVAIAFTSARKAWRAKGPAPFPHYLASKDNITARAPARKTSSTRANPVATSESAKLRYHIMIETAPSVWKLFAGFRTSADAVEYARALHVKFPSVSVKVES